jgi:hypothetical protein
MGKKQVKTRQNGRFPGERKVADTRGFCYNKQAEMQSWKRKKEGRRTYVRGDHGRVFFRLLPDL